MEVYLARQPIFNREMNVFGYELLYRRNNENNAFEYIDAEQATAEVINNAFLTNELSNLTDNTKAFINFSEQLLLKEIPRLLPKEQVVIEVLENIKPKPSIINILRGLRDDGYLIALDDFTFSEEFEPFIKLAQIIKVEYPAVDVERQKYFIQKYKKQYGTIFLAEKIETREQQKKALAIGYDLLQGYFYSKPLMVKGKGIEALKTSILRMIQEVEKEEPDYNILANIIEKDLSLSYKLLRIVNAVGYGSRHKITSINQALVRLGTDEIKKWIYVLMLQDHRNVENNELVKISLIRAKLMELLALELGLRDQHFDFFLTGMFSSIDTLLNKSMEEIISSLPLSKGVEEALLGKSNQAFQLLQVILHIERGEWTALDRHELVNDIKEGTLMSLYIHSIKWVMEINN